MTSIELIAVLFGLINVTLVVRRNVWNFPFGIVMVSLYAVIFFREKLYSDALLQVFFFAVQFYGWWAWTAARSTAGEVLVERLSNGARLRWLAGCLVAIIASGELMRRFTDAALPWWDAAVAIPSVAAQILLSRRKVESWWLWIAVDLLAIGLYANRGLWPTAFLYVVFLGLAIWGLLDWSRARHPTGPAVA